MATVISRNLDWSVDLQLSTGRVFTLCPPLGRDCLLFELITSDETLSAFQKDLRLFQEKIEPKSDENNLLDWDLAELEELFEFGRRNFRFLSLDDYYRAVYLISKERVDSSMEYWDNQPIDKLYRCLAIAEKVQQEKAQSMKPKKVRK